MVHFITDHTHADHFQSFLEEREICLASRHLVNATWDNHEWGIAIDVMTSSVSGVVGVVSVLSPKNTRNMFASVQRKNAAGKLHFILPSSFDGFDRLLNEYGDTMAGKISVHE